MSENPVVKKDVEYAVDTPAFGSVVGFEASQRMAIAVSKSDLVPQQFRNNVPNCLIAIDLAQRSGISVLTVMQNLYIVHGKPAWLSQYVIACVNACGKFSPLRYQLTGREGTDERTCVAWALDKATGDRLESPAVSIAMAKKEGWYEKSGSKWKTMPELMLRYRAATFFGRTYAPELTMGLHTKEEIIDTEAIVVESSPLSPGRHDMSEKKAEMNNFTYLDEESPTPSEEEFNKLKEATSKLPDAAVYSADNTPKDACPQYQEVAQLMKDGRKKQKIAKCLEQVYRDTGVMINELRDIDPADERICRMILGRYNQ